METGTVESAPPVSDDGEIVIPLLREELTVGKKTVETRRVTVRRLTREHSELVAEPLGGGTVEITCELIGRQVDSAPAIREEGDTLVIPILEERLVVERRLFLKEEWRVRRVPVSTTHHEHVRLRHHEIEISTTPAQSSPTESTSADGALPGREVVSSMSQSGEEK